MKNPILSFCRWLALRRSHSTVPTRLLPLKKLRSATVFVDAKDPLQEDTETVCRAVRQFFEYQGIPVRILCPQKQDIDLIGRLKPRVRGTRKEPRQEDLFVSLVPAAGDCAEEYEARCSTARFKVGRYPLSGRVYDLVVAAPADAELAQTTQMAAFSIIKDCLGKIR